MVRPVVLAAVALAISGCAGARIHKPDWPAVSRAAQEAKYVFVARLDVEADLDAAALALYVDGDFLGNRGVVVSAKPLELRAPALELLDVAPERAGLVVWTLDAAPGSKKVAAWVTFGAIAPGDAVLRWHPGMTESQAIFTPLDGSCAQCSVDPPGNGSFVGLATEIPGPDIYDLGEVHVSGRVSNQTDLNPFNAAGEVEMTVKSGSNVQVRAEESAAQSTAAAARLGLDAGKIVSLASKWSTRRFSEVDQLLGR